MRGLIAFAVAAFALAGCGGSAPPPAPEPAAAPKSAALDRADALIADMKKREAALQSATAVDVLSSNYTLMDRGKTVWRFSWKMTVRNREKTPIRVRAEMVFRDTSGSVVEYGRETVTINGSTVAEVTGFANIKAGDAQRVTAATPNVALLGR